MRLPYRPRLRAIVLVLAGAALLSSCAALNRAVNGPNARKDEDGGPGDFADVGKSITGAFSGGNLKGGVDEIKMAARMTAKPFIDSLDAISMKDERALGQAAALHVIDRDGGLILDHGLIRYVNEVGNLVAQGGHRYVTKTGLQRTEARRFFFGVVNSDEVNAYSCPGGYILVTRGLFEKLSSESDLAFVLGHEIAHVDFEDGLTALKAQALGGGLESILVGSPEEGSGLANQEFFGKVVGFLVEIVANGGFQKKDERRADEEGLKYAVAAGYDARGAERVLELLAATTRNSRTHKSPRDRLAFLRHQIEKAPAGNIGAERFDRLGAQRVEVALHPAR